MKRSSNCSLCGDTGYIIDKTTEFCAAHVCTCHASCPVCGGTGYIRAKEGAYDVLRRCSCGQLFRRIALFNAAKIPARCDGTLDSFFAYSAELEAARDAARTVVMTYKKSAPPHGFILSGPVGTGKSHLLCAVLRELTLERGVPARYVESSFLYSEIKNGFSHGQSVLEALEPLIEPDVLAIDEIGRGRGSAFEMETIDELIARRYNTRKTTLLATNCRIDDKPMARTGDDYARQSGGSDFLVDRIGERSWSRIHEMCHLIALGNAADYRSESLSPERAEFPGGRQ